MLGKGLAYKVGVVAICMKLLSNGEGKELVREVIGAMGSHSKNPNLVWVWGLVRVMVRTGKAFWRK
jgi:hypothetical protein